MIKHHPKHHLRNTCCIFPTFHKQIQEKYGRFSIDMVQPPDVWTINRYHQLPQRKGWLHFQNSTHGANISRLWFCHKKLEQNSPQRLGKWSGPLQMRIPFWNGSPGDNSCHGKQEADKSRLLTPCNTYSWLSHPRKSHHPYQEIWSDPTFWHSPQKILNIQTVTQLSGST